MTTCNAEAHLIAEGRVVGMLRCDLPAGHELPTRQPTHDFGGRAGHCHRCGVTRRRAGEFDCDPIPGQRAHEARIHWEDGEVIAEDDDEPGVEVPFDEPGA